MINNITFDESIYFIYRILECKTDEPIYFSEFKERYLYMDANENDVVRGGFRVLQKLLKFIEENNVEVKKFTFESSSFDFFSALSGDLDYQVFKHYLGKENLLYCYDGLASKDSCKSLVNIFVEENFELGDLHILVNAINSLYFQNNFSELFDFIDFNFFIEKEKQKIVRHKLNGYLKEYIQNNSKMKPFYFYKFEKQKDLVLGILKEKIEKYGDDFELKLDYRDNSFCPLHAMFSLEFLSYFKIKRIEPIDFKSKKIIVKMAINVVSRDKIFKDQKLEIENNNKEIELNKKEVKFNAEESVLIFNGKEIQISKNNNTDSHNLLETIFKDKLKIWNYDEVAKDWDIGDDRYDNEWKVFNNKFYQAGYKINNKVANKTTIEDFLKITKRKVNINKKYL